MEAILEIFPLDFQWKTQDPFLFCVHHEDFYPNGNKDMGPDASLDGRMIGSDFNVKDGWRMYHGTTVPGFPAHPHRGFETVTIVRKGLVDHADSMGATGRFGNGDVQWMTAGKGVQHSEMFPLLDGEGENPFELFQIWLNLPRAKKMVPAYYKMLWSEEMTRFKVKDKEDKETELLLVSGAYHERKALEPTPDSWAADPNNYVKIWSIKMQAGAKFQLPADPAGLNRSLFFFKGGQANIAGSNVSVNFGLNLKSEIELEIENGDEEAEFLLLQGRPINEPVVQHGPFVMNYPAEIQETFLEYQKTEFGGWPWPRHDYVHPRTKGRFAKYADGRLEEKS